MSKKNKSIQTIIALVISIFSFLVAVGSLIISYQSRQDSRAVALFDVEPEVSFRLVPYDLADRSPYFTISNTGRGDAKSVEIAFVFRYFNNENNKLFSSLSGPSWKIDLLKPMDIISQALPDRWDFVIAYPSRCEPHHRVLVVRITYFSGPDRKLNALRTFYFYNGNFYNLKKGVRNWFEIGSKALESGEYPKIVKAALNSDPLPSRSFGSGTSKISSPKLYPIHQD